jgi:sulfate transport system ATP-binding protein
LLDEPFGALDAQVRKELRAWLRRLHDEVHVTTVFVTHDQEEAIEISDDIVVLAGGKIVQSGAPAALYDHPANDFVMRFLGPVTELNGALVRPHDLEISLEPTTDSTAAVVRRIVKLGFEVRVDLQARGGQEISAQLTRASSAQLDLAPGREVYVRLTAGARSLQLAG